MSEPLPRIASLATIPERARILPRVLDSLAPQVDRVYVCANGFEEADADAVAKLGKACDAHDVHLVLSALECDRGDGGKFYPFLEETDVDLGLHWRLTCDDDFYYAPGYVDHLVEAAERLAAPVSLHGVVLDERLRTGEQVPWLRYGRKKWLRACDWVIEDTEVHILGTGVACFRSDWVQLREEDFEAPHSADIWFSRACKAQGVRRFVPIHQPDLAAAIAPPMTKGPRKLRHDGTYTARIAAAAPWEIF